MRVLDNFLNDEGPLEFFMGAVSVMTIASVLSVWPSWRFVQDFWGGAWL